jgi:uncharacterized protein
VKNPLSVNTVELLRRPGTEKTIRLTVSPSSIGLDDPRLVLDAEVEIDLHCESLSDGIVVDGEVAARFRGDCRRCLAPVEGRLESPMHELYQVHLTDPDAFPIEGDQIDLAVAVRETVLLDLPDAPVCRADCAGLCPVCGIDLNAGSCSCETPSTDPRWAALDALRDQLPE